MPFWQERERLVIATTIAGYLYTAVRNRALNHVRRARVEERWSRRARHDGDVVPLHSRRSAADDDLVAGDLVAAIERALLELPPRCRQASILRRQQNLSYAEQMAVQTALMTLDYDCAIAAPLPRATTVLGRNLVLLQAHREELARFGLGPPSRTDPAPRW